MNEEQAKDPTFGLVEGVLMHRKGYLHSPFLVFLRPRPQLSDEALLRLLGLEIYAPAESSFRTHCTAHVYLIRVGGWIHVADDWRYTLWHRGHALVAGLARAPAIGSLFSCHVGEADASFGFAHYEDGELRRRLEVTDPHYDRARRRVEVDQGSPLSAETALDHVPRDPQAYVLALAESLGVVTVHAPADVRYYVPSSQRPT